MKEGLVSQYTVKIDSAWEKNKLPEKLKVLKIMWETGLADTSFNNICEYFIAKLKNLETLHLKTFFNPM
jgi:hypothetical protein